MAQSPEGMRECDPDRPPLSHLVFQHAEEAASLRDARSFLVRAGHIDLDALGRLDARIAAHLDGLAVAGSEAAWDALDPSSAQTRGGAFVACVCALLDGDQRRLSALINASEPFMPMRSGLLSALGWLPPRALAPAEEVLNDAFSPWRRWLAVSVRTAVSSELPQEQVDKLLEGPDAESIVWALRLIGRTGHVASLDACLDRLGDEDELVAFEAARSALLLGDRSQAASMARVALSPTHPNAIEAIRLAVAVSDVSATRTLLAAVAAAAPPGRVLMQGIAASGDVHYVPWLIDRMADAGLARRAAEAFVFITGADLMRLQLDRPMPAGAGESEGDEADVALDDDEGLAWPDPTKVAAWWRAHGNEFARDTRHFLGSVPTVATLVTALRVGWQPQRAAAAELLALHRPDSPLFNVAAPAWRQRRLLDQGA